LRTRAWNAAMAASPGALDLDVLAPQVSGVTPLALRGGRLLSNGPGWTSIGGVTAHPFDGHGYVRAFEFLEGGGLRLRARFVATPTYRAEAEAKRLVRRGLATNVPGGPLRNVKPGPSRNVANTTIVRWGDRLLAGREGGVPFGLDPSSLETLGEADFHGVIAGQATLAHMKRAPEGGRLVLLSLAGFMKPHLTFREVDAAGVVVSKAEAALPAPLFLHDFAVTDEWYVIAGNPVRPLPARLASSVLGFGTLLTSIAPDLERSPVLYLVPRRGGPTRVVRLPGPAFVVHFGNAFQRDGAVTADICAFESFTFGGEFGYSGPHAPFDPSLPDARKPQRLVRLTVPAGQDVATATVLSAHGIDFPRVHPGWEGRDAALLFGATRADTRHSDPFDSIIRVDLRDPQRPPQLWTVPDGCFVGEPIFVPEDGREDAGSVLAIVSDGGRGETRLVVLDAGQLAAGPVASVTLPLLPVAFHGDWDAAAGRA
jgi:carotenoid cleavage dioxygenase-like enzyme